MTEMASGSHDRRSAAARSRQWWVADEEPEIVAAELSEGPRLPRWMRARTLMVLGLAAAALGTAILF